MPQKDAVLPAEHLGRVWIITETREEPWARSLQDYLVARGHRVQLYQVAEAVGRVALGSLSDNLSSLARKVPMFGPEGASDLVEELAQRPPQLIVTRSADAARVVQNVRALISGNFALLALIDDFEMPNAWVDLRPDFAVAPSAEQLDVMGFGEKDATRRIVAGPMAPFGRSGSDQRAAVRASLQAGEDAVVVMIDASRLTASLIDQVVHQVGTLASNIKALEVIFYYGDAKENAEVLRSAARARRVHARMFGASMPLEKVLAGVDLVVTGAQSSVRLESVFVGIPLIALEASAAQHVLAQHGVMVPLAHPASLGALLQEIATQGIAASHKEATQAFSSLMQDADVFEAIERLVQQASSLAVPRMEQRSNDASVLVFEEIGANAPAATPTGFRTEGLTPAAAREELSRLILEQRRLEKLHETAVANRDLWLMRLQDAEAEKAADLEEFARGMVERSLSEVRTLQEQLDLVFDAKERVHAQTSGATRRGAETLSASANTPAMMEKRFVEMESRRQLRELRERAKKKGPSEG